MGQAVAIYKEVRFILEDELTQCYVFIEGRGDIPIETHGWHHKTFPASKTAVNILNDFVKDDPMLWSLNSPE